MEKLLSICIPVFNGSKLIDQTLKSLLIATDGLSGTLFEILISDNASEDDTLIKVDKFKKSGLNLSVIQNKKNFGYDQNLDILIKNSNGNFTWFLGCGEICKKNSVKKLIDFLSSKNKISNIILNFDIFSEDLNKISCRSVYNLSNNLSITGKNNFKKNRYSAALSANVVNTKLWLQSIDLPLVEKNWCHVERILAIISLSKDSETHILSDSYFTLYQDVDGWWNNDDSYKVLIQHLNVIDNMPNLGFNEKSYRKVRSFQEGASVLNALVLSRKKGFTFNTKNLSDFRSLFSLSFYYLYIVPIVYLPIYISIFVMNLYNNLLRSLKLIYNSSRIFK